MTDTLEKQQPGTLATLPDDLVRDAGRGTEKIDERDLRPPMVMLCQSGTPQRKEGNEKFIPDLRELDIFNDLTEENYGRGPLKFVVFTVLGAKGIEFKPIDEGGGIVDMDVPLDDPRMQFGPEGEKPQATKFLEFLIWLIEQQEPAVLSMKGSNLGVATQLQRKVKLPIKGELIDPALKGQILMDPPAWARIFSVSTTMKNENNYAWGKYVLKMEGLTPPDVRQICSGLATSYAKKNIIIERVPGDDDVSFDPAAMESKPSDM